MEDMRGQRIPMSLMEGETGGNPEGLISSCVSIGNDTTDCAVMLQAGCENSSKKILH